MSQELIWNIDEHNIKELYTLVDDAVASSWAASRGLGSNDNNQWQMKLHKLHSFLNKIATVPASAMVYQ